MDVDSLVKQICVEHVDWPEMFREEVAHVFDFGPGHASGIGALSNRFLQGSGSQVSL